MAVAPVGSADPATSVTGPGVVIVGRDIVPGTYETSGPSVKGGECQWETLEQHATGPQTRIGGGASQSGPMFATVMANPQAIVGFMTGGCATWQLVP